MERNKSPLILPTILIFCLIPSICSAAYTHQFLERPIINALNSRDEYYGKVGIAHNKTTFNLLRTKNGVLALRNQLEQNIDLFSPWYRFLLGIAHLDSSVDMAAINFEEAIKCAHDDPGAIWVLFNEFHDAGQDQWALECLDQLEKAFLSRGARSAPVLAHQLLAMARSFDLEGDTQARDVFYKWSSSFERYPFWQSFSKGFSDLPGRPRGIFSAYTGCINMIYTSWNLQLKLFYYLYRWFRYALIFFLCSILITLSLKLLPVALHRFSCLYPLSASPRLRYYFVFIIFTSFIFLGIIPFFLFVALFLWPHLEKGNKKLVGAVIILLLLSPLDSRIQEMFRFTLSEKEPLGLLQKSIHEGYYADLEQQINKDIKNNDADYLSHISAAILNLKKKDPVAALINIKHYEELIGNDPVALVTAGNIYYLNDDLDKAKLYYEKCLKAFPQNEYALFNLGQINLNSKAGAKITEHTSLAAEINPGLINSFLEKNSKHFPDTTQPKLRLFIQPEYKPLYFWRYIFLKNNGSWQNTAKIWGATAFGLPPLLFLFIMPVFVIILIIRMNRSSSNILFCKLCGCPMCIKCRIGLLCMNCARKIGTLHSDKIKSDKRSKIQGTAVVTDKFIQTTLNILFPGTGELYRTSAIGFSCIIVLCMTSLLYGAYVSLFTFNFSYPFWIVKTTFLVLFFGLLVYNILFAIYYIRALSVELRPEDMEVASYVT